MDFDFEAKFNKSRSDFDKRFKLISGLAVVAPLLIMGLVLVAFLSGNLKAKPGEKTVGDIFNTMDISFGINGMSEIRCMGGYKFIVAENGTNRQVLNENGGGVKCD